MNRCGCVRDMVQNTEGIAKILAITLQTVIGYSGLKKRHTLRYSNRSRGVYTVQAPNPGRDYARSSAAAATHVEPLSVRGKNRPRKDGEVILKYLQSFNIVQLRLIKSTPFITKASYSLRIDIFQCMQSTERIKQANKS
jgi:hypothetical protein